MIRKFKKKPVVIEAVRYDGTFQGWMDIRKDFGLESGIEGHFQHSTLTIKTLEGEMRAAPNDWIIKGVNGEFYPCKPDIFEKTYEEVLSAKQHHRQLTNGVTMRISDMVVRERLAKAQRENRLLKKFITDCLCDDSICRECGQTCYCHGDIDDCEMGENPNCVHQCEELEDDYEDEGPRKLDGTTRSFCECSKDGIIRGCENCNHTGVV